MRFERAIACTVVALGAASCGTAILPHRPVKEPKGDLYLAGARTSHAFLQMREDRFQVFRAGDPSDKTLVGQQEPRSVTVLPAVQGLGSEVGCVPQAQKYAAEADRALVESESAGSTGAWLVVGGSAVMVGGGAAGLAMMIDADNRGESIAPGGIVAVSSLVAGLVLTGWAVEEFFQEQQQYTVATVRTLDAINAYDDLRGQTKACGRTVSP